MPDNPSRFTISARCGGTARSSTRCAAASAMVLADLWADQGCRDIQLIDPQGRASTRESFRALLLRAHKLGRGAILTAHHPVGRLPA